MGRYPVKPTLEGLTAIFARKHRVAIRDCVHFCAYRYGRNEVNPYEKFAIDLAAGRPISHIKSDFRDFLRYYRPTDLGEALGVKLSNSYPLWYLPWRTPRQVASAPGWQQNPEALPDIMTFFCQKGVPVTGLKREYDQHQRAFGFIKNAGYLPESYGYILVREMRGCHKSGYLVTDGNHRLSSLSALGKKQALVKVLVGATIRVDKAHRWPLVRAGLMTHADALLVFNAYLSGNRNPMKATCPATLT